MIKFDSASHSSILLARATISMLRRAIAFVWVQKFKGPKVPTRCSMYQVNEKPMLRCGEELLDREELRGLRADGAWQDPDL
jgi:hypothetical protein